MVLDFAIIMIMGSIHYSASYHNTPLDKRLLGKYRSICFAIRKSKDTILHLCVSIRNKIQSVLFKDIKVIILKDYTVSQEIYQYDTWYTVHTSHGSGQYCAFIS